MDIRGAGTRIKAVEKITEIIAFKVKKNERFISILSLEILIINIMVN
jgi:hypothetical protein